MVSEGKDRVVFGWLYTMNRLKCRMVVEYGKTLIVISTKVDILV